MHIAIHRHRSGQDHLSPGCTGRTQQGSGSQEVFTYASAGLYSKSALLAEQLYVQHPFLASTGALGNVLSILIRATMFCDKSDADPYLGLS